MNWLIQQDFDLIFMYDIYTLCNSFLKTQSIFFVFFTRVKFKKVVPP